MFTQKSSHGRIFSLKKILRPYFLIAEFLLLGVGLIIFLFVSITEDDSCDTGTQHVVQTDTSGDTEQNAQIIFNHLVHAEGFSGAGAAGALGNAAGREDKTLDPAVTGPAGSGVAGIFQWSGFSNNRNGGRITREGSIRANDKSTLTLDNELKLVSWELHNTYSDVAQKVGKATDPAQAAIDWSRNYEMPGAPGSAAEKTEDITSSAKMYYQKFGGSSIQANTAILGARDAATAGQKAETNGQHVELADNCGDSGTNPANSKGYSLPVKGSYSLGTGTYPSYSELSTKHDHNGVDFQNQNLTEDDVKNGNKNSWVYAVHDGKVVAVNHNKDEFVVIIKQTDNNFAYYGHAMKEPPVHVGDQVKRGDHITYQGYGGDVEPKNIKAAHVHFGLSKKDSGFGGDTQTPSWNQPILSPADYLPLPSSVLPDINKSSHDNDDRVIGSGFTKFFMAAGQDSNTN
ncbi:Glycyl-glycine endopeptidase LytM precursor [Fructobacillus sp. EFB-N1]|uniref:phage tail tip lysozyme n=1 Tax=Fructobacillus sp. EFB-N1 TaxID=1658766 RepID=UPI00065D3E7C|nr:phage tail tip lysozyme [Fructobacillus sp. EFB-N1]KMK53646.1 Glycyl-glycine endopeptidase LytM precursor [Fructobacillus sp. EFB-N1]